MSLTKAQKEYLKKKSPILWLEEYKIKNEQGQRIDFYNHLFQYDMFLDMSPKQAVQKPAQVGESTKNILKTLHAAYYNNLDIIYTLPTANDVKEFVSGKVNRIIANNQILEDWTKDKDSIEQKRVGNNVIYFKGTWTEKAAMMVTSDLNVYDEVDASKQDVIEQYSTRLQHSKFGWEWWFSHPSFKGVGVNKFFELSDQKHWFHKCSRCNHRFFMSWPENVDVERKCYICTKCKQPLRDEDRRVGQWVKRWKDKEISGYQVSSLMCPWISAEKIIEYFKTKSEEYFYNKVLGLPYIGADSIVNEETILQNCTGKEYEPDNRRIVIGCDTGLTQYYVMGTVNGIFYYGKSDGYEEIEKVMRKFPNAVLVMDAKGDLTKPRDLQKKYPNRVFLCDYRMDRKTLQIVHFGTNQEYGSVVVDRNRMIQLMIEEFKQKKIPLIGKREKWQEYYEHYRNIYREEEMDVLDLPRRIWKRNGADHWVHATVYFRTGMSKFAKESKIIMPSFDVHASLNSRPSSPHIIEEEPLDWKIP